MKLLIDRIQDWFGIDSLNGVDDFYEKAKIRLLFRVAFMAFFTLLFSLPATYLIYPTACLISGLALILIVFVPHLLKQTQSVSLTGKFTLLISFLIVLNVHLVFNKPDALGVGAWYIVIILCASFILGRNWGMWFTVATAVAIFLLVGFKYFNINLYDSDFEFRIDQSPAVLLSTPFHTILPIFLIYLIVLEFFEVKIIHRWAHERNDDQTKVAE